VARESLGSMGCICVVCAAAPGKLVYACICRSDSEGLTLVHPNWVVYMRVRACVCVSELVCACVHVCVHVCVRACVHASVRVSGLCCCAKGGLGLSRTRRECSSATQRQWNGKTGRHPLV
jgi:hypothetical protein